MDVTISLGKEICITEALYSLVGLDLPLISVAAFMADCFHESVDFVHQPILFLFISVFYYSRMFQICQAKMVGIRLSETVEFLPFFHLSHCSWRYLQAESKCSNSSSNAVSFSESVSASVSASFEMVSSSSAIFLAVLRYLSTALQGFG